MGWYRCLHFWTGFWLSTMFHVFLIALLIVAKKFAGNLQVENLAHKCATSWGRSFFFLNPWWKYKITGRENFENLKDSAVIVANHQSSVDILIMYLLNAQFRWLSKASMFKFPLVGWGMAVAGYIPVKRGDKKSQKKAYNSSIDVLKRDVSMLYFPEGTRSETGELAAFKVGAFRLAKETNKPLLPIVLIGSRDLMPKNGFVPGCASMEMKVLPPIYPSDDLSAAELMEKTRASFLTELT